MNIEITTSNEAGKFLYENRDIIALEVFEHASAEYRTYLEKQINLRNNLLEDELNQDTYNQVRRMEEQIQIMLGFFGIVETTLKTLSEKAYRHLNFDANEWERYKAIEMENEQWMQIFKLKFGEGKI